MHEDASKITLCRTYCRNVLLPTYDFYIFFDILYALLAARYTSAET